MSDIVIKVENLSKQYRLGTVGTGTLSHDLNRWWHLIRGKEDPYLKIGDINDRSIKGSSDYVWALQDINFEVKRGEVLGIIGKNGAGKSTLLKILSKTTTPTFGSIGIKGRIASLLEVGTGFHPELSGRENIFLNGAILGMTREEVKRNFDAIVDFSGVERYVDTPVKRYSSGMYVRLAFAVAAHLESEILIVDEVLAVGDAEFQKKAIGKMQSISKGEGRTVLFVSHNLNAVRNLCTSGLLMEYGKSILQSNINAVIDRYQLKTYNNTSWAGTDGDENVVIEQTYIKNKQALLVGNRLNTSDTLEVGLVINVKTDLNDIVIGFNILSIDLNPILRASYNDFNNFTKLPLGRYTITFNIPPYLLASGNYKIDFDIALPFIKKINSDNINLEFELDAKDNFGNRYYLENSPIYNSIIRPNLFDKIIKE